VAKIHRISRVIFCKRAPNYRALLRTMTRQSSGNLVVIHSCLALRARDTGWRRLIGCRMSFSAKEPLIIGHSCLKLRVRSTGWRRLLGCGMSFSAKQPLSLGHSCLALKARGTGWRRITGCLKSQVIIHQRATNYRALLRKMTYKNKVSYDSMQLCRGVYLFLTDSLYSSFFLSHSFFLSLSPTFFLFMYLHINIEQETGGYSEVDESLTFSFYSIYVYIQHIQVYTKI